LWFFAPVITLLFTSDFPWINTHTFLCWSCLRGRITLFLCKIIILLGILMPFILTSSGTLIHQSSLSFHPQSITFLVAPLLITNMFIYSLS
jgi:hypothetical protein